MDDHSAQHVAHLRARIKARSTEQDCGFDSLCWISNRAAHSNGYTKITWQGRTHLTHRLAYEVFIGSIPDGLVIDHLCRQRACCNPMHIEAVPTRINLLRGEGFVAEQARRDRCPVGHSLSGDNLYLRPDRPGRDCRACRAASGVRANARLKAKRATR